MATVRPSIQPSSRSRFTNAVTHWLVAEGEAAPKNPMVGGQNREFLRRNREFERKNRESEPSIVQIDFRMTFSEGTGSDLRQGQDARPRNVFYAGNKVKSLNASSRQFVVTLPP
jgi:hypothetical protein